MKFLLVVLLLATPAIAGAAHPRRAVKRGKRWIHTTVKTILSRVAA